MDRKRGRIALKTMGKSPKMKYMTTKEVSEFTGIAISTVCKYAIKLNITHYGEGRRKVYDWKETDIARLKKAMKEAKVGKPPKKEKK